MQLNTHIFTPPETTITVTFNTNGGSTIASDVIDADFSMPAVPTKEGYIFVGWFEENEKVEVITEGNHKLVARWELENNDKNPGDGKDPNDSKDPLKEAKEKTLSRMLDRIIDLNPELTKKELQDKLGAQFDKSVERRVATKNDIEKIFRKYINKYLENVV